MTAGELIALWKERDNRYRMRKVGGMRSPLTSDEAYAVVEWRKSEISALPPMERREAWTELAHWAPPAVTYR